MKMLLSNSTYHRLPLNLVSPLPEDVLESPTQRRGARRRAGSVEAEQGSTEDRSRPKRRRMLSDPKQSFAPGADVELLFNGKMNLIDFKRSFADSSCCCQQKNGTRRLWIRLSKLGSGASFYSTTAQPSYQTTRFQFVYECQPSGRRCR